MKQDCYEKTKKIGKHKLKGIVIFTSDNRVKLLLSIDNGELYYKVLEFTLENKVSEAVKYMLAEKLIQTYELMLLPTMLQHNKKIKPEIKEVVKIRDMEEYIKGTVFSVLKSAIPLLKIKDTI